MAKNKSNDNELMEKLVSLAKQRGFIFQSSDIYGGLNSFYDYGPLGVELKNNVKQAWWNSMVKQQRDVVGLDSSILMHPKIWEASGHVENFSDPLVDCRKCKRRFRADHLLEAKGIKPDLGTFKQHGEALKECPECGGELTEVRQFNLMFKTFMGPIEDESSVVYLRPETAQGIYVNFLNVQESLRMKLPFGIAQIGKAFRNEITPGNFIFRTREFEQMEMQYFVHPEQADELFEKWKATRMQWWLDMGIKKENLRFREHGSDELAHYAKKAVDIEYHTPFGWKELEGIHNRGDWDLSRHMEFSGKDLYYTDPQTGEKFIPYIVETSAGADRGTLMFLLDAYTAVEGGRTTTTQSIKEEETVMKFSKNLAPIKIAVLPLSKKSELTQPTSEIYKSLSLQWMCQYDETGSIGKRYRRQDEIGTPYCITVDFETLQDSAVTVRDRDTMNQERIKIEELPNYFRNKLN